MWKRTGYVGILSVAAFWLGLLVGVSFIATPVKFAAPTLSLPVALDVGRVTFALFSKVEWVAAPVLVATVIINRPGPAIRLGAIVAGVIVAVQALWLLPILDARIASVIAGVPEPASYHHTLYVALELAKAAALLWTVVLAARELTASHTSRFISGEEDDRAAYPR